MRTASWPTSWRRSGCASATRWSPASKVDVKPGNAMPLASMPVGTIVHNIELKPGKGGQIARSAGTYAQLVGRDAGYAILRLNSGETRMVRAECMATVGAVSNPDHRTSRSARPAARAGRARRPTVRGVAMNPVDHPHGGGEGRTTGGRHPVTPWGKPTKGKKTRKNKATDKFIIRAAAIAKKKEVAHVARSVWKGPFVDGYLLKKAEKARGVRPQRDHQDLVRRSTILPQFVGLTFGVYNGQKHIPVNVTEDMIGHKFGEFAPTRTFTATRARQEGEEDEGKSWARRSASARSPTTRRRRWRSMLARQPAAS